MISSKIGESGEGIDYNQAVAEILSIHPQLEMAQLPPTVESPNLSFILIALEYFNANGTFPTFREPSIISWNRNPSDCSELIFRYNLRNEQQTPVQGVYYNWPGELINLHLKIGGIALRQEYPFLESEVPAGLRQMISKAEAEFGKGKEVAFLLSRSGKFVDTYFESPFSSKRTPVEWEIEEQLGLTYFDFSQDSLLRYMFETLARKTSTPVTV